MSQRNIVTGWWFNRGKMKLLPVCRVCDEIMIRPGQMSTGKKFLIFVGLIFFIPMILNFIVLLFAR